MRGTLGQFNPPSPQAVQCEEGLQRQQPRAIIRPTQLAEDGTGSHLSICENDATRHLDQR
jgi:hypothetical protein